MYGAYMDLFDYIAGTQHWMAVQVALIQRQDVESAFGRRCVPAGLILKPSFFFHLDLFP